MHRTAKKTAMSKSTENDDQTSKFFDGQHIYILANGMGKNRVDLFKTALAKNGANLVDENQEINLTQIGDRFVYIIIDENTIKSWENVEKAMAKKKFFAGLKTCKYKVIKSSWLSECIKQKRMVETVGFELVMDVVKKNEPETSKSAMSEKLFAEQSRAVDNLDENVLDKICKFEKKLNIDFRKTTKKEISDESNSDSEKKKPSKRMKTELDSSSYTNSESDSNDAFDKEYFERELKTKTQNLLDTKSWTCAQSSKEQKVNHNKHIIDKLEEMSSIYENTKDKFRALGYQKAIMALRRIPNAIENREQAMAIPGIGKRIADKIWEIVQTGDLSKLENLKSREDINSVKLFTSIHGIGPTTAQNFISQGFRTLEDLKTKANLNRQQQIGIRYHEEFMQRIPRDEVVKIEKIVKDAALSINNGLIIETCGSYRRGKPSCGDVDVLVTHPDGHSHKKIFNKLIDKLHEIGFLTDDLVVQDESIDTQRKYLGVCKLPEEKSLHRRLDIIVVPYDEYACALLYFTGSAHFNRSMRHLARKLGLSLSEKSLNKNVIRKGTEKTNLGERINTPTEQDVFKYLNIPYRTPQERDF